MLPITLITDNSSVDLLLNKFCDPYTSLGIGLPDSLQNKSLIVCYDKNKALIHMAFYYNNSFYSKNGGGVLHTVYKRFSDIKRHYPEIKYIRTYKIKPNIRNKIMKRFPHYQQHDQMDCGPTCLRMIAAFYGKHYSLERLREKSFITRLGVSMLGISEAAEKIVSVPWVCKYPFNNCWRMHPCLALYIGTSNTLWWCIAWRKDKCGWPIREPEK